MESIYSVSYISLLVSAILWFFLRSRNLSTTLAKGGFFTSLIIYFLSLLLENGDLLYKLLLILPRDLGLFIVVVLIFNKYVAKSRIFIFLSIALFMGIKFFWFKTLTQTFADASSSKSELLMDMGDGKDVDDLKAILEQYEIDYAKAFPNLKHEEYSNLDDYYTLDISDRHDEEKEEIKAKLMATGLVDWVENNEEVKADPVIQSNTAPADVPVVSNDPDLSKLWGFKSMDIAGLFNLIKEKNVKPSKTAKVAILDTGVEADHEDIGDNYSSTKKEYDSDKMGHGTHCAGIAGAVTNNGKGIASFLPSDEFVEITSIKVLDDNGGGTQHSVISGIIEAADQGADVISMSLGGMSTDERQRAYIEAVQYAQKAGAIVVVAAGNSDDSATDYVPANVDGVITVSALDENLNKADFSNEVSGVTRGIAAPGVNIYSTYPGNSYKFLSGTSMATPYVAGLLGLMKSIEPSLTTDQAYALLKENGLQTSDTQKTGMLIQPQKVIAKMAK